MLRLSASALQRPLLWILCCSALTLLLAYSLSGINIRTDGAALYPAGNAMVELSEADRNTFNDPEHIIVLAEENADGPPLQSAEGYAFLRKVHLALSELKGVHSNGVLSVVNQLDVSTRESQYSVRAFLDLVPTEPDELNALTARLHQDQLIGGLFLAPSGTTAAFYIPVAEDTDRKELLASLDTWLAAQSESAYDLSVTGPLVAEALLGDMVISDLLWLVPLMMLVITILLLLTLRSIAGVLIPLIEVLITLIWTLGAMALCGIPITLVTTIMPIILVAMAVTDEIHLLERLQFYLQRNKLATAPPREQRELIRRAFMQALGDVARPVVVTSLTTAAGFLSFLAASVAPLQHFGVFSSLGIVLAMLLSFTFIPALAILMPARWFQPVLPGGIRQIFDKLRIHGNPRARYRSGSLLGSAAIILISLPGLFMLSVQDSWIDNFDPRSSLVRAEQVFNQQFWGSYRFDVVIEGREGFFNSAEGLQLVDKCYNALRRGPYVGGVASLLDPYDGAAKVLDDDRPLLALPPDSLSMMLDIANFFAQQISLNQFISADAASARLRIFVNSPDYLRSLALQEFLQRELPLLLGSHQVSYHFSGDIPLALEVVHEIVNNQLRSIAGSLLGVLLLLLIAFRGRLVSFVLMLPVSFAAMLMLAGMGYVGIPLGIATSMFAPLAIGIGVDFALHFTHRYRMQRRSGLAHADAVRESIATSGKAIAWNALVLALGFLVLTLSSLKPNHSLGLLLAGAMLCCYLCTLYLLPRLLWLTDGRNADLPSKGNPALNGHVIAPSKLAERHSD